MARLAVVKATFAWLLSLPACAAFVRLLFNVESFAASACALGKDTGEREMNLVEGQALPSNRLFNVGLASTTGFERSKYDAPHGVIPGRARI